MTEASPKGRPSRLLNLNKSHASKKRLTALNNRDSPLLSLPPELRSRMYDYVFDVGVIHVDATKSTDYPAHGPFTYQLLICHCPEVFSKTYPRIIHRPRRDSSVSKSERTMEAHKDCLYVEHVRKPLRLYLNVGLLQTSRQIYHEAVLKPFSTNRFHYVSNEIIGTRYPLQLLLEALAPAQVRAIKRLDIVLVEGSFPLNTVIHQLKGLEHVEVCQVLSYYREGGTLQSGKFGIITLDKLHLKSMRITTETEGTFSSDLLLTDTEQDTVVAWQKSMETKLVKLTAK